jgi:hypothetical protein
MKIFAYKNINKKQKGISIIEVVIASAIISLSMIAISNVYGNFLQLSLENTEKVQAVFLLDEGVESLNIMRNYSWKSIASSTPSTNYYLEWKDNKWQSTTTPNIIDNKFIRKFTVENVYRDPSTLNIVYSGGVLNNDTKMINMDVSWNYKNSTSTKQISFYVFNLYE